MTHEVRINADINDKMSITAGAFMSDLELLEHNMFTYPGAVESDIGWGTNYALTDTSVYGYQALMSGGALKSKQYAGAGWHSGRGPYESPVQFINDVKRTDKQKGIFGELSIDLADDIELTLGARWYDIAVDLEGSANASFSTGFGGGDQQRFGTNLL
jgi:outer membrane receptor protein involved in Fe transport